ncbi:hypothetical protein PAXRUDRAFT_835942 [Paxillus rubicundulus Ve08.2h10]|uniref:HTH CENPB-type domain-containing protein n=1 Tax=Paxillus rubicundulus Ve08.2h10 TaxID=930991 RepID=A0A0D0BT34_9AGAM|nr:hypothetical protein PAXRUDRAFT_835942 [Paxillus rubicundulus Ve08.2h10]
MAGHQGQRASTMVLEYENHMELAVKDLIDGTYKTIDAAAKAHEVAHQMLSDHVHGIHRACRESYKDSQHLNETQENIMNEWLVQNSSMATPLHPHDLCAHAFEITGKLPGKNWHQKYLNRHGEPLKASKPKTSSKFQLNKLPQSSLLTHSAFIPDQSQFPSSSSSNSYMSHSTHAPSSYMQDMSHNSPYTLHMSHNVPLTSHLLHHSYSHINYHTSGNSPYDSGQTPFN